jgi:hypothetical protein
MRFPVGASLLAKGHPGQQNNLDQDPLFKSLVK